MIKMKDVAKKAGVSLSTVSRVFNDSAAVSRANKEKVLQAAKKLGYKTPRRAREATIIHGGNLAVVAPFITRPFFVEVLQGITDAARLHNFNVIIHNVNEVEQYNEILERSVSDNSIDAVLIISLGVNQQQQKIIAAYQKPYVSIDSRSAYGPSISVDNEYGAALAVQHLISLGHEQIACLHGSADPSFAPDHERLQGYRRAILQAGIVLDDRLEFEAKSSKTDVPGAVEKILNSQRKPTAIFATSDSRAITALQTLSARGVQVPEQISLVGFDDLEFSSALGITTIRQPMKTMGRSGFRLVFEMLQRKKIISENIHYRPELVIRRTCSEHRKER